VEALIGVSGGDAVSELTGLAGWLRGERELQGNVRLVRPPAAEGTLGGALDVLAVAVGSGGMGVALAQSLQAWLRTRVSDVRLTVTVGERKAELDARRVGDPAALIAQILKVLDGDDAGE
jgi:hypothetical protein